MNRPELILIVDDEAYVTTVVGDQLRRRGHQVIVGCDGEEGVALARLNRPALIISDFQMPMVSGLEMSQRLHLEVATSNIPIILLTGRGHRLSPQDLAPTGVRHVLAKPFSIKELMGKVDEVLASTRRPPHVREVA